MLKKTEGIVINSFKYTDNSVITRIYTREHGMLSFVVNKTFSKRAAVPQALLQPLTIINLEIYLKPGRNFQKIKEASVSVPYISIPDNIHKRTMILFLSEVLKKTIQEEETNHTLYDFIRSAMILFDNMEHGINNFHLFFLTRLINHLGFMPNNNFSPETPLFNLRTGGFSDYNYDEVMQIDIMTSNHLHKLLACKYDNLHLLDINNETRREILEVLINYYSTHIEGLREINSYKILQEVYQ